MTEISGETAACLWLVCTAAATFGCGYAVFAGWLIARFAAISQPVPDAAEPVTLLKPLHGAEAELSADLASFCGQRYSGKVQMLCGVQDLADPAISVVEALRKQYPAYDFTLVAAPDKRGENPKISNIINMMPLSSAPANVSVLMTLRGVDGGDDA